MTAPQSHRTVVMRHFAGEFLGAVYGRDLRARDAAAQEPTEPETLVEAARALSDAEVEEIRRRAIINRMTDAIAYVAQEYPVQVMEILCACIEDMRHAAPDGYGLFSESLRDDAAYWADSASPAELEAYVSAGLIAIGKRRLAENAAKRAMIALWNKHSDADRKAFLARVDPKGVLRARSI